MSITRQQIAEKALSLLGTPFLHQGRSRETGVDCVGILAVVLTELGYPVVDVEGYRRTPPAEVIYQTMKANFDEIAISEAGVGDIFLMRIGGRKPKHASIFVSDATDLPRGIEPQIIHARAVGSRGSVVIEPLNMWLNKCVYAFRLRGLET